MPRNQGFARERIRVLGQVVGQAGKVSLPLLAKCKASLSERWAAKGDGVRVGIHGPFNSLPHHGGGQAMADTAWIWPPTLVRSNYIHLKKCTSYLFNF